MPFPEPSEYARAQAERLLVLMRGLVGSHYLSGATGDIPDRAITGASCDENGMPRNGASRVVRLMENHPDPDAPPRQHPGRRVDPNLFAAYTNIRFPTVCAGRCDEVSGLPDALPLPTRPDMNALRECMRRPEAYRWPRTYRRGAGGPAGTLRTARGECCLGKRHFDCVGLLGFCTWRITGLRRQWSINQWMSIGEGRDMVTLWPSDQAITPDDLRCGDIIISKGTHVSIATGSRSRTVIEAQCEERGVKENPCPRLHTKIVRRFTDRFWHGL